MASKLENRVARLENNSTAGKTHLVLPNGWWYDEEGCEPYETTKLIQHKTLNDWYADVNSEGEYRGK